jgi:hypothetical protein
MNTANNPNSGLNSLLASDLAPSSEYNWSKIYSAASANGSFRGEKLTIGGTGNVYTAGRLIGTADFDPGAGSFELTSVNQTVGDGCIGKLKQDGTFAWAKQFRGVDGNSSAIITSIAVDLNGNTYSTGQLTGSVDFGGATLNAQNGARFITKLDAGGNLVWAKQIGGNSTPGESADANLVADRDGNIYITGGYSGTIDLDANGGVSNVSGGGTFATKWNTNGDYIWGKQVDANMVPSAGITIVEGGITYIAGSAANGLSSVIKLNADGSTAWSRQYNLGVANGMQGLDIDAAGNVYAIGYYTNTVDFDPSAGIANRTVFNSGVNFDVDIFVTKLNADGSFSWVKQLPTRLDGATNALRNGALKIEVNDAGNAYVAGVGELPFLSKLAVNNGSVVWTKELTSAPIDLGFDPAGNLVLTAALNGTVDLNPSEAGVAQATGSNTNYVLQLKDAAGIRTPDLLLRNRQTGEIKLWDLVQGNRLNQETVLRYGSSYGAQAGQAVTGFAGWTLAASGDFNADGMTDFVWQNLPARRVVIGYMGNNGTLNYADFLKLRGDYFDTTSDWVVSGAADMNGDGHVDLVVRNAAADFSGVWLLNGVDTQLVGARAFAYADGTLVKTGSTNVAIAGLGDFDGDGKVDILHRWANTDFTAIWAMDGTTMKSARFIAATSGAPRPSFQVQVSAIGDLNGDGVSDILFRDGVTGRNYLWTQAKSTGNYAAFNQTELPVLPSNWRISGGADFNQDGTTDLILHDPLSDQVVVWAMKNGAVDLVPSLNGTDFIKTRQNVIAKPGSAAWGIESIGRFAL